MTQQPDDTTKVIQVVCVACEKEYEITVSVQEEAIYGGVECPACHSTKARIMTAIASKNWLIAEGGTIQEKKVD